VDFEQIGELHARVFVVQREMVMVTRASGNQFFVGYDDADYPLHDGVIIA
jgi:hypothetical protein